MVEPITEGWLREVGFKWHQFERQPDKHWLLWIGGAIGDRVTSYEDLGIELAPWRDGEWFCWLRADTAHRYGRFLHVRHLKWRDELAELVAALTGQVWSPQNHIHGHAYTPEAAARLRAEHDRLDRKLLRESPPWRESEKDDSRGGALPEHMEHFDRTKDKAP